MEELPEFKTSSFFSPSAAMNFIEGAGRRERSRGRAEPPFAALRGRGAPGTAGRGSLGLSPTEG